MSDYLDYNLAIAEAQNRLEELQRVKNPSRQEEESIKSLRRYIYQLAMDRDYTARSIGMVDCALDPDDPYCQMDDV